MHKWNSCCLQNLGFRTQDNPDIPPLQLAAYDLSIYIPNSIHHPCFISSYSYDGTIQVSSQNESKNTTSNDPKDQPFWQPRLKPAPLLQQTQGSGEEKNAGVSKGGTKLRVSFSPRLFEENQCIKTQIYRNVCQSIVRSKVGNF